MTEDSNQIINNISHNFMDEDNFDKLTFIIE